MAPLPAAEVRDARALALWLLVALACALPARAEDSPATWSGTVVAIADGDTITVLDARKVQHHIRLAAIDAPERTQPYSQRARQHLADLVFRKTVDVRNVATDRYGREVAMVVVEGRDVALAQLEAGFAWHFTRYPLGDPQLRTDYETAEAAARQARNGLWASADPEPPWAYRARKREEATAPR